MWHELVRHKKVAIDLLETVEIGGIKQSLYIRGEDINKPVILFLHGGPGLPVIPFLHKFQYLWEKTYTIVQWDQRNAGKTFYLNDPDVVLKSMSFERALEDAHEITQYLKQKLKKEQIIILGWSWGSVLGSALVQAYPHDYIAYISVGQCVNFRENERVGYKALLDKVNAKGNSKDISIVQSFAPYPPETYDNNYNQQILKIREYQAKYGLGVTPVWKKVLPLLTSPYYKLKEKGYFLQDFLRYHGPIIRFLLENYDARNFGTTYTIPVFYIMGEQDFQTPYPLAKDFFEEISAPKKKFFSIPNAGHDPMQDNPQKFNQVLLDEIYREIIV